MNDDLSKVLYSIIVIELSVALLLQSLIMLVLLLTFSILAIVIRMNRMAILVKQKQPSTGLRGFLHQILVVNKILPPESDNQMNLVTSLRIADIESESLILDIPDNTFIENLRLMGVDGILICIMLLQEETTLISAKNFHKNLKIPLSTVYRTLQRITEKKMVKTSYTLDEPGKAYYSIASEGESVIIELYEWLSRIEPTFLPSLQISEKGVV